MDNDVYGREVYTVEEDTYVVVDNTGNGINGTSFTLSVPENTPLEHLYNIINAMAPEWYQPPVEDSEEEEDAP